MLITGVSDTGYKSFTGVNDHGDNLVNQKV